MSGAKVRGQMCSIPVPDGPGDEDRRDNCKLAKGHDGPHVGLDHAHWELTDRIEAPTWRVVTRDDGCGWDVWQRVTA